MLEINALAFEYFDKPLFKNVKFKVEHGQSCHIQGKNGVGKTTLLKLIAGLLQPTAGEVVYKGQSVASNLISYQSQLCYLGHKIGISPFLTVKENAELNWPRRRKGTSIENLLEKFSLNLLKDKLCMHLSLGQKQRVGLLRLAMTEAKLWLLDEPFTALDQDAVQLLMELFENHLGSGGQILLISHQDFVLDWQDSISYYL